MPEHFSQRSAAITALVKILNSVADHLDHPATLKEAVLKSLGLMETASASVQEAATVLRSRLRVSVPDELIEQKKFATAGRVISACRRIQRAWRETIDYRDKQSFDRLLEADDFSAPRNFQVLAVASVRIQRAYRNFSDRRDRKNLQRLLSLT